ncbi:MAG: hypothetical protein HY861_03150 [Chlamydiia bacterium]|nr:hypothetical protein [Chlamydiia bacterium]
MAIQLQDISKPAQPNPKDNEFSLGTATQSSFIAFDRDAGVEGFQQKLQTIWTDAGKAVRDIAPAATDIRVSFSGLRISYIVGGKTHYIDQFSLDPQLVALMIEVRDVSKKLATVIHSSEPGIEANRSLAASSPFQITSEKWKAQQVKSPQEFIDKDHFEALHQSLDAPQKASAVLHIETAHSFIEHLKTNLREKIAECEARPTPPNLSVDEQTEFAKTKQRQQKLLQDLLDRLESINLFAVYWTIASWGRLNTDSADPSTKTEQVEAAKKMKEAMFEYLKKTAGGKKWNFRNDETTHTPLRDFAIESACTLMHGTAEHIEFLRQQGGIPVVALSAEEFVLFQLMHLMDGMGDPHPNEGAILSDFSSLGLPRQLPAEDAVLLSETLTLARQNTRQDLATAQKKLADQGNPSTWQEQHKALAQ